MNISLQTTQQIEINFKLKSQTQKILDYMLKGNRINTWKAYELFKCTCLAQRIFDLKNTYGFVLNGNEIKSETVNRNGKHFTEYWIDNINA